MEVEALRAVDLATLLHHPLAQTAEAAGEGLRSELGDEIRHASILREIVKYLNSGLSGRGRPRQLTDIPSGSGRGEAFAKHLADFFVRGTSATRPAEGRP